jgi:hypothetical protein
MPRTRKIGIALRSPGGDLEPCGELEARELEALAAQAGLQGLRLQEWLIIVLRAIIDHDRERKPGRSLEECLGKHWLELPLPAELWQDLKAQCRAYSEDLAYFAHLALVDLAEGGLVPVAQRYVSWDFAPATVAELLLQERATRAEIDSQAGRLLEEHGWKEFDRAKRGPYAKAIARALRGGLRRVHPT